MGSAGERQREHQTAARPHVSDQPSTETVDEERGWIARVRRDRPVWYAARHLVSPVAKLVLAAAGIGALLRTVLPRFAPDVEWLDAWGRERLAWVPDPLGWVGRQLAERFGPFEVAEWFGGVLQHARWWVPVVVALVVGAAVVLRRWEAASDGGGVAKDDGRGSR